MLTAVLAISWLGWVSTVVVPLLLACIPLGYALILRKLDALDKRNSTQHRQAQDVRAERFDALEDRLDMALELLADSNRVTHEVNKKVDDHLRDHLQGVA